MPISVETVPRSISGGLELVAAIPWHDRVLVMQVTRGTLAEARCSCPAATIDDLLATFPVVVVRRPVAAG